MKCILIGGGGHGRVLFETIEKQRPGVVVGVLDKNRQMKTFEGIPVLGGDELLPHLKGRDHFTHFVIGVDADVTQRAALYVAARKAGLEPLAVIHPTAWISPNAKLAPGCQVLAHAVVNTNAQLGGHVLVNTSAVVERDAIVGAHAHIGTRAVVCAAAQVKETTFIEPGSVVKG